MICCFCFSKLDIHTNRVDANLNIRGRAEVVCMGMLAPRKLFRKRKKQEVFRDATDEAEKKNWRRLIKEIEETGSAVPVLKSERIKSRIISKDLVVGTLVRFKQLSKWKLVSEVCRDAHFCLVVAYIFGS